MKNIKLIALTTVCTAALSAAAYFSSTQNSWARAEFTQPVVSGSITAAFDGFESFDPPILVTHACAATGVDACHGSTPPTTAQIDLCKANLKLLCDKPANAACQEMTDSGGVLTTPVKCDRPKPKTGPKPKATTESESM